MQVFGRNQILWFIPLMGKTGKPKGSGVIWPLKNGNTSINEDAVATDDIVTKYIYIYYNRLKLIRILVRKHIRMK